MPSEDQFVTIPEPAALPILGHLACIDAAAPVQSIQRLADHFGEIFRLRLGSNTLLVLSSVRLVHEACDEKRFRKKVGSVLREIRRAVHDGLFTAYEGEPNWAVAHRILMPAFGPMAMRRMFDGMHDISTQLAMKWARHGPDYLINVADDFTRLALDTIALCSMGYRFNSFYSPEVNPFLTAMANFLVESGDRTRRIPLPGLLYRSRDQKYEEDIAKLRQTAEAVLTARKTEMAAAAASGSPLALPYKDLLTAMLEDADPKTGARMSDESIIDNLITFLIAGHETTSGLLSFSFYNLLLHPTTYETAQREVDAAIGSSGHVTLETLNKLPYVSAVLRETLRLNAPIPGFNIEPREDDVLAGRYKVAKGEQILLLLAKSHLDREVYGDDAQDFKPERMMGKAFEKLTAEHPSAWKPFGNGMRACIGRPFAWQEALLTMAILLHNFNFVLEDNYVLRIKETLTLKPYNLRMRAILRPGITATTLERRLAGMAISTTETDNGVKRNGTAEGKDAAANGFPMTILYGSNSGTCEALAQRVASDATVHGFRAVTVDCLDSAKDHLPKDSPVVIITASYEGQPPDNAGHFVAWLEGLKRSTDTDRVKNVPFAVFGCGNHDWVQTFHRVPRLIDTALETLGATRVAPMGLSDVAAGNVFTDFETWEDEVLWPALEDRYVAELQTQAARPTRAMEVSVVSDPRTSALRQTDVHDAIVAEARVLTASPVPTSDGDSEKRHIRLTLPANSTYACGDYLAVLPRNPPASVERVLRFFKLPSDAYISVSVPLTGAGSQSFRTALPTNTPTLARTLFTSYVELAQPATKRNVQALAAVATHENTRKTLEALTQPEQFTKITEQRASVLDLLERFGQSRVPLALGDFLAMLPPMRVRQYSISSSPMRDPGAASITFSVLRAPALAALPDPSTAAAPDNTSPDKHESPNMFNGVASTYLASLQIGDRVQVSVRPSHAAFGLPSADDMRAKPMVCVAAGTGIAPFRGFVEERALLLAAQSNNDTIPAPLAPCVIFFGCRSKGWDDLYRDEFDAWEHAGAVTMRRAFSRPNGDSKATPATSDDGHKSENKHGGMYVQDLLWESRREIVDLWKKGAMFYICGSRRMAEGVRRVVVRIRMEMVREQLAANGGDESEADEERAKRWVEEMRNIRYVSDVFD